MYIVEQTKMDYRRILAILLLTIFTIGNHHVSNVAAAANTRSSEANVTRQAYRIDTECGAEADLPMRINECAEPLMVILSGRLKKWPRNDADAEEICDGFGFTERCIKDSARRCAKGIQKTIISTIGTSVQRVRKRECSRNKYPVVLKTIYCVETHQKEVQDLMTSVLSRLKAVETQEHRADKKVNAVCCMIDDIEREFRTIFDSYCPEEAKTVQRLFRGVVDTAVQTVCRQPKCKDYMKRYNVVKSEREFDGLVSLLLKIVFSLDADES